jgi:hypothetical protein
MAAPTLLIATTPLTALVGAALARADGGGWQLVLVEDFGEAAAWADLLRGWRDTPFARVECLPGRASEARALAALGRRGLAQRFLRERIKREQRRAVFARLAEIDATLRPARVAVGNDRRPETQYALALAARRGDPRPGAYLDDGLFSYVGDVHARPLARALVDTPLKRLAWGAWWQAVDVAGTSRWIARAHLALPELALDRDASRVRHALPREAFATRAMARLALAAWHRFGGGSAPRLDAIVALPHSDLLRRDALALAAIARALARLAAAGRRVAVKHHPRERDADPLGFGAGGARLLPAAIAFELLLPLLRHGGVVAGSASTALLAARWLRPDLAVVDLGGGGAFGARASAFLEARGVRPASEFAAVVDALTKDRGYLRDS